MSKATPKKATAKKSPITFNVTKILLLNHFLNQENEFKNENRKNLKFAFESSVNIIADESVIQVITDYTLVYQNTDLFRMQVENDFKIDNFNDAVTDGKIANQQFFIFIIGISITHSRGIQSTLIKGTALDHLYIPPISKETILSKLTYAIPN